MEYGIRQLARLAGVSTRTLHYYDEIGLLSPRRVSHNQYRVYGPAEVDRLQAILLYRELGLPLADIIRVLGQQGYDRVAALQGHLEALRHKKEQIDLLIGNVEKTIAAVKGEIEMSDSDKFSGLKQKMVAENEEKYGEEVRTRYGDAAVDASNARLMGLKPDQFEAVQALSAQINEQLKAACTQGDPGSKQAQQVCALHERWLRHFWTHYSREAHLGLAQTYVDDPRFEAYYDAVGEGCAEFLRDALAIYCR
jgi:DNA-binding transcriptional MerR regulator